MAEKLKIGALISGGGTNLQAILDACQSGEIDGEVVFVGSDQPGVKGLERAEKHGVDRFVVDYAPYIDHPEAFALPGDFDLESIITRQSLFPSDAYSEKAVRFFTTRVLAEARLLEEMEKYSFDLLVLAGFMRIMTPYFIDRVNGTSSLPRIMNIHPALLPAFPGTDGYADTFNFGCKVGGCTVHFVDYGEDSGPIIGQMAYAIEPEDTEEAIRKKGLELEWKLYPQCIQFFAQKRLQLARRGKRTVVEIQ